MAKAYGRMTGFSGPIFTKEDEPFRGELELEDGLVALDTFRVPRTYWKVVVVVESGGELSLAAHLMDQFDMLEANVGRDFDLSDYLVSLKDLEQRARLRFDSTLHEASRLVFPRT